MLFGREPAVFYGLIASVLQLASALFLHLPAETQGVLNAAIVLIGGAIVAWKVSSDEGVALLGGVAKALIAVALAFGAHLSADTQSSIMLVVTMGIAFYLRTQVTAPKPAEVTV